MRNDDTWCLASQSVVRQRSLALLRSGAYVEDAVVVCIILIEAERFVILRSNAGQCLVGVVSGKHGANRPGQGA